MDYEDEIVFEIRDTGSFLKIEPLYFMYPESGYEWDRKWLKAKVKIKNYNFEGEYTAELMITDFTSFLAEFSKLYNNLKGIAVFSDLERYLNIKIIGNGIGHFSTDIVANDNASNNSMQLSFTLNFDQTQIKEMEHQLEKIIQFKK